MDRTEVGLFLINVAIALVSAVLYVIKGDSIYFIVSALEVILLTVYVFLTPR